MCSEENMRHKDKIEGGLADKKKPSDFDREQLAAGIKVELEHTSDRKIAREIAMDHLTEDPNYYKKLKTIEKYDRIDIKPDGKQEFDYGVEELNKEPDPKKRWKRLKKALDSSISIMSIAGQEYNPDEDEDMQDDQGQPEKDGAEQDEEAESQDTSDSAQQAPEQEAPAQDGNDEESKMAEEEIIRALKDEGYSDAEIAHIVHGHVLPEATVDDHKAKNEMVEGQINQQNLIEDAQIDREHRKRMNDLEYKKVQSEIVDPEEEKSHRGRMKDLEYETEMHRKHQADLKTQHEKRMLDLEYERAKRESEKQDPTEDMKAKQLEFELAMKRMERELDLEMQKEQRKIELEFKKKELQLKLKLQEETARQKAEHQAAQIEEDAKVNAAIKKEQAKHKIADAKKPPKKEKSGE